VSKDFAEYLVEFRPPAERRVRQLGSYLVSRLSSAPFMQHLLTPRDARADHAVWPKPLQLLSSQDAASSRRSAAVALNLQHICPRGQRYVKRQTRRETRTA